MVRLALTAPACQTNMKSTELLTTFTPDRHPPSPLPPPLLPPSLRACSPATCQLPCSSTNITLLHALPQVHKAAFVLPKFAADAIAAGAATARL